MEEFAKANGQILLPVIQVVGPTAAHALRVPVAVFRLVAPDEGHGFARPINALPVVTEMEKILGKVSRPTISGKSVPSDARERLRQITVDPKTVSLTAG
jgi:hypothetical protein